MRVSNRGAELDPGLHNKRLSGNDSQCVLRESRQSMEKNSLGFRSVEKEVDGGPCHWVKWCGHPELSVSWHVLNERVVSLT